MATSRSAKTAGAKSGSSRKGGGDVDLRFQAANVNSLFAVLDAVAWLESPTCKEIAQFAGIDPRTAGKLLKNGCMLGLLDSLNNDRYLLVLPYPYKGSMEQKQAVVREALIRLPLMKNMRQFLQLGESFDDALRKAATVVGVRDYSAAALAPLVTWARALAALKPGVDLEDLLDDATEAKEERHKKDSKQRVAFVSHSSKDKPFIRKLTADLTAQGVSVWLDEQRIRVGDSIPDQIAQGLAESDIFLIALSENSVSSEWVKRELNSALLDEISKRKVHILPMKLSECEIPGIIRDKKYADFTKSYKEGFKELLEAIKSLEV
jgi:hypothetical protein